MVQLFLLELLLRLDDWTDVICFLKDIDHCPVVVLAFLLLVDHFHGGVEPTDHWLRDLCKDCMRVIKLVLLSKLALVEAIDLLERVAFVHFWGLL